MTRKIGDGTDSETIRFELSSCMIVAFSKKGPLPGKERDSLVSLSVNCHLIGSVTGPGLQLKAPLFKIPVPSVANLYVSSVKQASKSDSESSKMPLLFWSSPKSINFLSFSVKISVFVLVVFLESFLHLNFQYKNRGF